MREICPICSCEYKKVIKRIKLTIPEYFHLPSEYDIVACVDCGFCYAATQASLDDYEYYYSQCNSYSGTPNDSKAKTELLHQAVKLISSFNDKNMHCLDMGIGGGNFVRLLKKHGFNNVAGMDPSEDSIVKMQKEGFTVYKGSIFDEVRKDLKEVFDCVFLFDVLEHLLYPDIAIEKLSEFLKESGYLVISVPNYAALFEDNSILTNQFNQEHINYFSVISLDNLLKKHNFTRTDIEKIKKEEIVDGEELLVVYSRDKSDKHNIAGTYVYKDTICEESIRNYISRNSELEKLVDDKLIGFIERSKERTVYVWGTGAYVMWLLANTKMKNMNIIAFIDNNPTKIGKQYIGKLIINAESIEADIPILICCMRHSQEIVNQIIEQHISNEYLIL